MSAAGGSLHRPVTSALAPALAQIPSSRTRYLSTSVCTKAPFVTGPECATRSASTKPGGGSRQSEKVRTGIDRRIAGGALQRSRRIPGSARRETRLRAVYGTLDPWLLAEMRLRKSRTRIDCRAGKIAICHEQGRDRRDDDHRPDSPVRDRHIPQDARQDDRCWRAACTHRIPRHRYRPGLRCRRFSTRTCPCTSQGMANSR